MNFRAIRLSQGLEHAVCQFVQMFGGRKRPTESVSNVVAQVLLAMPIIVINAVPLIFNVLKHSFSIFQLYRPARVICLTRYAPSDEQIAQTDETPKANNSSALTLELDSLETTEEVTLVIEQQAVANDLRLSILVIEDNADMRNYVAESLMPKYQCLTAVNGKKGWQQQAVDYLTKPFDIEELHLRIENLLLLRNMLKQRFGEGLFAKPGKKADIS
jgi:CheY-like chemotaxis protein